MNVSAILFSVLLGFLFGVYASSLLFHGMSRATYQKCRYYDQTIERCVTELGWEKK
jgi:hypothetical protein